MKKFYLFLFFAPILFFGQTNTYVSSTTGNWSTSTNWSLGHIPLANEDVVIPSSSTVTLNAVTIPATGRLNSVSVSGALIFSQTVKQTLSLNTLTVNLGGTFQSNSLGTIATHIIDCSGNINNNGTIDFSTSGNLAGATISFSGAANQMFSGTGNTDLYKIAMTKSALDVTGATNTVEFLMSNFSVRGLSTGATGALLTSNSGTGMLKFSGTNSFDGTLWSITNYTIPATLGLWLNNPNFTVNGMANNAVLSGTLRISSGTYNIGTTLPYALTGNNAATKLILDGGSFNCTGRLLMSAATSSYNQSAGTITVATIGNTTSNSASFYIAGNFDMSGGTIVIQNKSTGAIQLDYRNISATPIITGGTLNLGNSQTPAGVVFKIRDKTPSVTIDNSSNNNPGATLSAALKVFGDLTLNGTGTFSKGNFSITLTGNSSTKPGNITLNTGSIFSINSSATVANALTFNSSFGNQSFTNNGGTIVSNQLPSLTINNTFSGGIVTLPSNLIMMNASTLTLINGIVNVGIGGSGTITYGVSNGTFTCIRTAGSMVAATSSFGTIGTKSYTYNGAGIQTTGAELPTTLPIINNLTINNATANISLSTPLSVLGTLTLTNGLITTTSSNLLTLGSAIAAGTLLPATITSASFINGPIARTFAKRNSAAIYNNTTLFPVGKGGIFLPIYMAPTTSIAGVQLKAEAFDTNSGTNISPTGTISNTRWEAFAITNPSNLTNVFIKEVSGSIVAGNIILKSTSAAGIYKNIIPVSTVVVGTSLTTATAMTNAEFTSTGYFCFGNGCSTPPVISGRQNICKGTNAQLIANAPGTWSSSNTAIATVDSTGLVSGIAAGTATITFTETSVGYCNGVNETLMITISECSVTPGGIGSNLVTWYVGNDATPINWIDHAFNTNTLTAVANPTGGNYLNFNSVATLNGTSQYYEKTTTNGWSGANNASTYYYVARSATTASTRVVYGKGASNSATASAHGGQTSASRIFTSGASTGTAALSPTTQTWATNSINLNRSGYNGGATQPYYVASNGNTEVASANVASVNVVDTSRFRIGASVGTAANFWSGDIAEVIVYNGKHTATEYDKIQSYLAIKYGITLGSITTPTNYISSAGTIVWNGDATYQNNITGIGRDDDSGLNQKQSKSINANTLVTISKSNEITTTNQLNNGIFSANDSFILFGDNNLATTYSSYTGGFETETKMARTWKVQRKGSDTGNVTIHCSDISAKYLIVSPNSNFSSSVTEYLLDNNMATNVVLTNGCYFTFSECNSVPIDITTLNQNVCPNKLYTITATVGNDVINTMTWETSPPAIGTIFTDSAGTIPYNGESLATIYVKPTATTTYILTNNNFNCPKQDNVTFTVNTATYAPVLYGGTGWSITPTIDTPIIINQDLTISSNISACSCTINPSVIVNVTSNATMLLENDLTVDSFTGSLTFENGTSLLQLSENAVNTGNIIYKRTAVGIHGYDYVYWSSPVDNQIISSIYTSPTMGGKYSWNPTFANPTGFGQGNWETASSVMDVAKGYIIRGSNVSSMPATNIDAQFIGTPRNGEISYTVERGNITTSTPPNAINTAGIKNTDDNFNLIGNPYPSAINANEFLGDPENSAIEGSIALWTHGSPLLSGNADPFYQNFDSNYSENDYIVYNLSGALPGPGGFNGNIAAGQAFFVQMLESGPASNTIKFKNSMRTDGVGAAYNNTQFYRTNNTVVAKQESEKHRIWLDIVDANHNASRTLVGYVANATEDKDRLYDAVSTTSSTQTYSYSMIGTERMTIQAKGLPFDNQDTFRIGFNAVQAGTYTMALFAVDGLFENQNIYLEDTLLNVIHDIKASPYTFTTATAGSNDSRFILRFTNTAIVNRVIDSVENVILSTQNKQITIHSTVENIKSVFVYDLLGREIINKKGINQTQAVLNAGIATQTLIVKITLENGQTVTKKVFIK